MKKVSLLLCCLFSLASCAELTSMIVEDSLQSGLQGAQTNHKRTRSDDKKLEKQQEELKKAGKCPTCRGMGKTPDGMYECTVCKGTGKYIETNNKQD
jgi:DnaJ-class molecular chaperone